MRTPHRLALARLALAAVLLLTPAATAQVTRPSTRPAMTDDIARRLASLPPHPRLIITADVHRRIVAARDTDPTARALADRIVAAADALLTAPPPERQMVGRRLLGVSRDVLHRSMTLCSAYRLTGDMRYARKAEADLLAAAGFSDWNPSHFLDVGEMSAALAFGLDWLDPVLPPETKATLKQALIDKGLRPSFNTGHAWFLTSTNNWNQVCNGGMVLAALVTADVDRELSARVIARAVESLPIAMHEYAPDGAYPEGPGYWEYGTVYNVLLLASLDSALGTDFGLSALPGFASTADYFLHTTGPTGLFFNYADCGQRGKNQAAAPMFYFAARLRRPDLLTQEHAFLAAQLAAGPKAFSARSMTFAPLLLAWAIDVPPTGATPPLHYGGQGSTPVALLRSSWRTDATFAGIKAGYAANHHGHMDAATFVLDALGTRWAEDLGMQNYESLESRKLDLWNMKQTGGRWTVYRLNNTSHNVLTVNDRPHLVTGKATLDLATVDRAVVTATPVYGPDLASHRRGLRLLPPTDPAPRPTPSSTLPPTGATTAPSDLTAVLIQDELSAPPDRPATVRWQFLTRATVTPTPTGWTLSRDGKTLHVTVTGVDHLSTSAAPAQGPSDLDAPNPGVTVASFETTLPANTKATWRITFGPTPTTPIPPEPLRDW